MNMFSSIFVSIILWINNVNCNAELQFLDTYEADVYSSSSEFGSTPKYAVDRETGEFTPTCSKTSSQLGDEYNWFILDLGVFTTHISEIRIAIDNTLVNTDLTDIDIFLAKHISTIALQGSNATPTSFQLPWDDYIFCNSTNNHLLSINGAIVNCDPPQKGRWIIFRRKNKPLVICMLAVYTRRLTDKCFENVNGEARADEFRLERHITHGQCQDSCLKTPNCQAIIFKQKRRTGICHLLQNFNVHNEGILPVNCIAEKTCTLQENICHRGRILPLIPDAGQDYRLWKIDWPHSLRKHVLEVRHLYAIQLKGRIICKAIDCGFIEIRIIGLNGENTLCNIIDTKMVSILDRYTLYCRNNTSTAPTNLIKVRKSTKKTTNDSLIPSSDPVINIEGGYVRFFEISGPEQEFRRLPYLPELYKSSQNIEKQEMSKSLEAKQTTQASLYPGAVLQEGTNPIITGNSTTLSENNKTETEIKNVVLPELTTAQTFVFSDKKFFIAVGIILAILVVIASIGIWCFCKRTTKPKSDKIVKNCSGC